MSEQYLIWDFDGTLFDSYPHILRAFRRALARLGAGDADGKEIEDKVRISVGTGVSFFASRYSLDPESLLRTYQEEENGKDDADVLLFDGIGKLLRETKEDGWHHFLYTHRGMSAYIYLDREYVRSCFDDFITAADGFPSKPAPDAILHLVGKHALPPERTWMIGDRIIDVQAGRNAGIRAVLFDPEKRISDTAGFPKAENAEGIISVIERQRP